MNGEAANAEALAALATYNYGHFTSMQARGRSVRGLDLHLQRLDSATRELFGQPLAAERVREALRLALGDSPDATVRITVYSAARARGEPALDVDLLVSVGPPRDDACEPLRVRAVRHERPLPHIKHVGTFFLIHQAETAPKAGYDDTIFVDHSGRISEGTVWNVGFYDGRRIVWPDGPQLPGVTMLLVRAGLERLGVPQEVSPVRLSDLRDFKAAFITYSIGAGRLLASVDDHAFEGEPSISDLVRRAYELNAPQAP